MDTRCTECLKKGIFNEMILIKTARGKPLWKCEKCGYRWTYPSTAQERWTLMADKRTCPKCGMDWCSADTGVWICESCAAIMPPEVST